MINTLKVKVFSDGADRASMLEMNQDPVVAGLTTNPSLMKKAGIKDYKSFCNDILAQITRKPLSFEVFADEFTEMRRQAHEIKSWDKNGNVYVKIPVTNSKGQSSLELVRELAHQGIQLNVTAILTEKQVAQTCEALKGGAPSIVSVFAGRIADTGRDPVPLMKRSLELCRSADRKIELLWASTREVINIVQADEMGCDIITVPFDILKKWKQMWQKDLSVLSLETVQMFKNDAEAAGFTL